MSQIDQAFIQAYGVPSESTSGLEQPPSTIPLPVRTTPPHQQSTPIDMHPALGDSEAQQVIPMAAEPIPAPHFHAPVSAESYAPATTLQQSTRQQSAIGTGPIASPENRERRPLSTFSAAPQPIEASFQPVFEVDTFRWPDVASQFFTAHSHLLAPVVEQLMRASDEGRTMVGIVGARPGVGCTTVQLSLARLLAHAGKRVALVDANFLVGNLAQTLGLEVETGWEDALSASLPLAECVVYSLADQIALLPLKGRCRQADQLLAGIQTSISAGVLRYHYDVVLFDLGAAAYAPQATAVQAILRQCRLDASILVAGTSSTDTTAAKEIDHLLSLFGPTCLGLIGNDLQAA